MTVDISSDTAGAGAHEEQWFGHPRGLLVLFFAEMWERFSFYGMRGLLVFYLTKHFLFDDATATGIYATYGAMVYLTPVIGGLIADRLLGFRRAVIFGAVLLCLGHLGMAYEGQAAALVDGVVVRDDLGLQAFYLSIAFIIVGVGFLKPSISSIVGQLYAIDDPRRDAGFTADLFNNVSSDRRICRGCCDRGTGSYSIAQAQDAYLALTIRSET